MARTNVVGKTATTIFTDGDYTCVKYHSTDVIKWNNDVIILNSGRWRTNTTKLRINQASNQFRLGIQVYQKDFNWHVVVTDLKNMGQSNIEFVDGMIIKR